MKNLPSFDSAFGTQANRLKGIKNWEDIKTLGKLNIDRLIQIAQENSLKLMTNAEKDEISAVKNAIDFLSALSLTDIIKPLLPRLRNENIGNGDNVFIYIGDTAGNISK